MGTWIPLTQGTRIGDSSSGYGFEDGMFSFTTVFTRLSDSITVYPYRPASYTVTSSHIIEQNIRLLSSKQRQEAHVVACNIFPQSMIYTFLAGALNIHAMHHLNPRLTRQQLMQQYVEHPEQMNIMTLKGYYQLIKHL